MEGKYLQPMGELKHRVEIGDQTFIIDVPPIKWSEKELELMERGLKVSFDSTKDSEEAHSIVKLSEKLCLSKGFTNALIITYINKFKQPYK